MKRLLLLTALLVPVLAMAQDTSTWHDTVSQSSHLARGHACSAAKTIAASRIQEQEAKLRYAGRVVKGNFIKECSCESIDPKSPSFMSGAHSCSVDFGINYSSR